MSKKWDAPVYVFFKPSTTIKYVGSHKAHIFECGAARCHCRSKFVWCFLYTSDAGSTSNMHWHTKICWGDEAVIAADMTGNVQTACEALSKRKDSNGNGTITSAFERVRKGKVTYSQHVHTKLEARWVWIPYTPWISSNFLNQNIQCWVCELGCREQTAIPDHQWLCLLVAYEDRPTGMLYSVCWNPLAWCQECVY